MVRFLVLLLTAIIMTATPLASAQARARKPAAESSHHARKPAAKPAQAKGRGKAKPDRSSHKGRSARGGDDRDDGPRGRRGAPRKGHAEAKGRKAEAERADEDCKPAKPVRGRRHGRGRAPACSAPRADREEGAHRRGGRVVEEDCVRVAVKPSRAGRGRHAARGRAHTEMKCTRRLVRESALDEPAAHEREDRPAPPVLVVPAPDSPAEVVKRAPPGPGILTESNPDIWAKRGQAAHRPRPATGRLTLSALIGRSDTELRAALGVPDLERAEGGGALWTYRLSSCSLMVFLQRDGAEPLKVSGAQSVPLKRGGAFVDVDACLKAAATGR